MISIIIPAYNCESYIPKALGSALSQTLKDFEVIVVDDGSRDNTRKIVEKHMQNEPAALRYVYQDNKGPSAARNAGLGLAKGEYVTFLDADDYWENTFLELMYSELTKNDLDIIVCDNTRTELIKGKVVDHMIKRRSKVLECNKDLHVEFLEKDLIGGPARTLCKKEILTEIGGFDENLRLHQEWDLWIRVFKKPRKAKILREPLYHYHVRNDGSNITRRLRVSRSLSEIYTIYKKFEKDIKKNVRLKKVFAGYLWDCARQTLNSKDGLFSFIFYSVESLKLDFSITRISKSIKSRIIGTKSRGITT